MTSTTLHDQFSVTFDELEIWCPEHRDYFGMFDVAALVDVIWDDDVQDVGWFVSDWLVYSSKGSRRSASEMAKTSPFWAALNTILMAQVTNITDRIDDEVTERHPPTSDPNGEHRLSRSAFL